MSYVHTLLGTSIIWTEPQPDQWNPATRRYDKQEPITRTGTAWSAGPATDTVWVLPAERRDGEGSAVCVHATRKGHTMRPIDKRRSSAEMQAAALAALQHRVPMPVVMQRGENGYGAHGFGMARGA